MAIVEHSFDIEMAKRVGVNASIIFKNIEFWCAKNKANKKHFYDGNYWTYNSIKAWAELFPYLTESQIRTALKKLEDEGFILSGNYSENQYDRTKWFCVISQIDTIKNDKSICEKSQMEFEEIANGFESDDKCYNDTDINTDNKQDINTDNKQDINTDIDNSSKKSKVFIKPTLKEIQDYISEKSLSVDGKKFFDYFEAGEWRDSKGNKVRNWKQKILTWDNHSKPKEPNKKHWTDGVTTGDDFVDVDEI